MGLIPRGCPHCWGSSAAPQLTAGSPPVPQCPVTLTARQPLDRQAPGKQRVVPEQPRVPPWQSPETLSRVTMPGTISQQRPAPRPSTLDPLSAGPNHGCPLCCIEGL